MSSDDLSARARRIAEELLTQGNLAVADELFAPGCRHHAPHPFGVGARGVQRWTTRLRSAFPDLCAIVEDGFAVGDRAAQRLTLRGTHAAALDGVPAGDRRVAWTVVQVLRVGADGRFAEHWCVWDELGLCRQLGTLPDLPGEPR